MAMRGLRGAITVEHNTKEEIWQAAQELMTKLMEQNRLQPAAIGAAIFSMTEDLTAAFPTAGVRQLQGFGYVPFFDARQCAVDGSLPHCIRVLLLIETDKKQDELAHVYLREAQNLRPDLSAD